MSLDYDDMVDYGIEPHRADLLIECEKACEWQSEYEQEHKDAAAAYSIIFEESFGIDPLDIEEYYFDIYPNVGKNEPSVFLGQDEIEIQLPGKLTPTEAFYFSRHTDFVVNERNSDLAYGRYDDRLVVRARLYPEE